MQILKNDRGGTALDYGIPQTSYNHQSVAQDPGAVIKSKQPVISPDRITSRSQSVSVQTSALQRTGTGTLTSTMANAASISSSSPGNTRVERGLSPQNSEFNPQRNFSNRVGVASVSQGQTRVIQDFVRQETGSLSNTATQVANTSSSSQARVNANFPNQKADISALANAADKMANGLRSITGWETLAGFKGR